ncbi:hypothetical protein [Methanoculleus chikugoensis]|uniref:hypothetical protein n=1 Tax=Methanoculleus chikugoensis TaxID=118126 RepID=UPI0006D0C64E|nr:hypothetical protein [Methanoculleus chikugoensis]
MPSDRPPRLPPGMPDSAPPGTNRYKKTRSLEPLPRLLPTNTTPGHDGSPNVHLTMLEGRSLRGGILILRMHASPRGATLEDTLGGIWSSVVALIL